MLTDEERQEIGIELAQYEQKRGATPEALKIVQRHRGWVDAGAIDDVARELDLTSDEVAAVATAYNMIFCKPVGRHVVLVCDSVSCWVMNYEGVLRRLTERLGVGLGETTSDGRFTLLPAACLGACDHAPAMMIDEQLYGDLTDQRVDEILDEIDTEDRKEAR